MILMLWAQLDGLIRLDTFDGFPSKRVFVTTNHVLWTKTKESKRPETSLAFNFPFPSDEDAGFTMPPSCTLSIELISANEN